MIRVDPAGSRWAIQTSARFSTAERTLSWIRTGAVEGVALSAPAVEGAALSAPVVPHSWPLRHDRTGLRITWWRP